MAHIWLATVYEYLAGFTIRPAHDTVPLARAHAQRAVDLDPSLSEAHTKLGIVAA